MEPERGVKMAKIDLSIEEVEKAVEIFVAKEGFHFIKNPLDGNFEIQMEGDGIAAVGIEEGKFKCTDEKVGTALREIITENRQDAPKEAIKSSRIEDKMKKDESPKGEVESRALKPTTNLGIIPRDTQVKDLTMDDIKKYLCAKATDEEAFMFLKLCQARNLNPFLREAYLVKYDTAKPAQMVVGKDAFTRMAEDHPKFDGFKAGIIVSDGDKIEEREGTFLKKGDELLGGWAEVFRKDRKMPFKYSVSLKEYDKQQSTWKIMPATMIRKCALVGGLREAFPGTFSGMYDQAEIIEVDPSKEIKEAT
jgi:phage recombination protein Bet